MHGFDEAYTKTFADNPSEIQLIVLNLLRNMLFQEAQFIHGLICEEACRNLLFLIFLSASYLPL